jgi:cytochrome c oxidase subunit 2
MSLIRIGLVVFAIAVVSAVAGVRARALTPPDAPPSPDRQSAQARVVRITAERFAFTPSEVTVAEGTTIEFHLTSEDTAHGFRILGQSIDVAIPKRRRGEATVTFTPPKPGRYIFECSRMCGAGHSFMRGVLHVRTTTGGAQ